MSSCSDPVRRRLTLALAAGLALGPAAVRARDIEPSLPPPVDERLFQVREFDWQDASRARAVPVRLYLPVEASAPAPLLLFSHGMGGSRRGYRYLGSWLATRGVAALHVQHVGSDRELWFGSPWRLVERLQGAAREDPARIVACGHSYGANTALLLAGARVLREGQPLALQDPRLRAAIAISAPPFYGEPDPGAVLAGVQLPTLHITATGDVIPIPGYQSPASDRVAVFRGVAGPAWLAMFEGGSHSIFTDRSGTGGLALNPQVKAATRELVRAFLAQVLDGHQEELAQWPVQWAPLLAQWQQRGA